jgi:hypothetical protein
MNTAGSMYDLRKSRMPRAAMPKIGTATNTHRARADVDRQHVGDGDEQKDGADEWEIAVPALLRHVLNLRTNAIQHDLEQELAP